MVIICLTKLIVFAKKHSDSAKSLTTWKVIVENANWEKNRIYWRVSQLLRSLKVVRHGIKLCEVIPFYHRSEF
jgi:mRNA-degrading endonuclease HigB of HigAB toxin-antitoxin module